MRAAWSTKSLVSNPLCHLQGRTVVGSKVGLGLVSGEPRRSRTREPAVALTPVSMEGVRATVWPGEPVGVTDAAGWKSGRLTDSACRPRP